MSYFTYLCPSKSSSTANLNAYLNLVLLTTSKLELFVWLNWNITPCISSSAIQLLKDKAPGTFVVRDSNSFPGAFGLALKVATVPANVQTKSTGDPSLDLVRHFLIEPTPKGVRLRGCNNEPVFGLYHCKWLFVLIRGITLEKENVRLKLVHVCNMMNCNEF